MERAERILLSKADAAGAYLIAKVPYAVNYVDMDLDVTRDNDAQGEHDSHVADIAAANRYKDGAGKGYCSRAA